MENVMTIDFDIIMSNYLNCFNDLIRPETRDMDKLESDIPLYKYLPMSYDIYSKILLFYIRCLNIMDKDNIHFIHNHKDILRYINKPCDLINIDAHHDLGYNNDYNNVNCANWAYFLLENNLISSFGWLRGNEFCDYHLDKFNDKIQFNKNINQEDLSLYLIPDKLIMCASFEWVPSQYRELFNIFLELYKNKFGVEPKFN